MKTIDVKCCMCDRVFTIQVKLEDYNAWLAGKYTQDAFPYLSVGERELLISNTCNNCFDSIFYSVDED